MSDYALASLQPPDSVDYVAPAASCLAEMYGNDQVGDCVIAAGYHLVGVQTGMRGELYDATLEQVLGDYSAITGYVPGDPSTDQGTDELTALAYWQTTGFADGSRLTGSLRIDPTNNREMRIALWLFEGLLLTFETPDAWLSPIPSSSGFTWDVVGDPDPQNGHAIMAAGYHVGGMTIDTWGMLGTLTWDAAARYCSESAGGGVFVVLTEEVLARGQSKSPNGFDWSMLVADFEALGGSV